MIEFKRFLLSAFSVRARIVALALIPVGGFLANGIAFTSGDSDVRLAFASVNRAAALSDAAHGFKAALAAMRLNVRDFAVKPTLDLVGAFNDSRTQAIKSLDIVEGSLTDIERQDIAGLRQRVTSVANFFADLVKEQEALGFTDEEGARRQLKDAATNIERFVNVDMNKDATAWWLRSNDAQQLWVSLSALRRYGAEYRLTRTEVIGHLFANELNKFNQTVAAIGAPTETKEQLNAK